MYAWGRQRSKCKACGKKRKATTEEATAKKKQKPAFPPEPECVVCLDPAPAIILLPCGHQCICEACCAANKVKVGAQCPVCRQTVEVRAPAGSGA